jgi:lactonase
MAKNFPDGKQNSNMPLPPDLNGLPKIEAEPWFRVDDNPDLMLEGPAFDLEGNLFVTSPPAGIVFKITAKRNKRIIFDNPKVTVDGAAFHLDGRLFIVCITGEVLILNPNDYQASFWYPRFMGRSLIMNDLVFDTKGNFYVTDFIGTLSEPTGGVFRVSPDAKVIHPVALHLASPNGVSISPEGNVLWVGESSRNTVIRIALLEDGITCRPICGVMPVYYSSGSPGPDSNKVDSAGNLYQCINGQGRIVVLNGQGIPIANVVIPGRDEGKLLKTTNLAFKPGTREGYITTSGKGGAWIYKFTGLDKGLALFSHQRTHK